MKILLAQLNNIVGDIKGNTSKALEILNKAKEESIDLVVFSELFFHTTNLAKYQKCKQGSTIEFE